MFLINKKIKINNKKKKRLISNFNKIKKLSLALKKIKITIKLLQMQGESLKKTFGGAHF